MNAVDLATTQLYERARGGHAAFIARIDARRGGPAPKVDALVAIVPAAYYMENRHIGADGRVVRAAAERLGARCELIPISGSGGLAENARIILDWLAARADERIILATLCKGGADVKVALAQPGADAAFRRVAAWINICGTLSGSPLADWALDGRLRSTLTRLVCVRRDASLAVPRDVRHASGGPLDFPLRLPPGLRFISIAGFPLCEHLSSAVARRCHRQLARFGPNDGALLLAETCALPGELYPVWGADHYLRPEEKAASLVAAVLVEVAGG